MKNIRNLMMALVCIMAIAAATAYAAPQCRNITTIRECVNEVLADLRENTWWIESYRLGHWDCSTQSTTLWYLLAEKGIKSRIVAAVYCFGNMPQAHIYLQVEMDGRLVMVDATLLQIRDLPPEAYGYLPVQYYSNPEEANRAWPGEYIRMEVRRK